MPGRAGVPAGSEVVVADLGPLAREIIERYRDRWCVTHAAECWRWHSNCAVDRLAAYITDLELRIAELERQLAATRDMQDADR